MRFALKTAPQKTTWADPAVLANMAAAVDIVSGGRLELGLGAGWNETEAKAYGIDLLPLRQRMDRFDEACDVIVGLLREPRFTYDGEHCQIDGGYCEPKPVQQPHPPICVGGNGEKRTLRTVARVAQHWDYLGGPVEEFVRLRGVLDRHCAEIGRDPAEIMTSSHLWVDPAKPVDPAAIAAEAAGYEGSGLDLAIVYLHAPYDPAALPPIAAALPPIAEALVPLAA